MPDATKDLRSIRERNRRALELRPSVGQGTATTVARLRPGSLTTDIADGAWTLVADASPEEGGNAAGPDPGVFVRSALASCLAIGYRNFAAAMGIELTDVMVTVEADYDARGQYGFDGVAPGYPAVRVRVAISSNAPAEQVQAVIDAADRHSPILDDFVRRLSVTVDATITTSDAQVTAAGAGD